MHFAKKTQAQRQLVNPLQSVLKRRHIVRDLANVGLVRLRRARRLEQCEVRRRGLRALDPAGKHRFAIQKRLRQQVRIRQYPSDAAELPECMIRVRKPTHELKREIDFWRQWRRNKSGVTVQRFDQLSRIVSVKLRAIHETLRTPSRSILNQNGHKV